MEFKDWLDISFKLATIIIAIVNIIFAFKFFNKKNATEQAQKEKDRKYMWFKALILDHNLKHFYSFFEKIENSFGYLKKDNFDDSFKQSIDQQIGEHFILLRQQFIDTINAVDSALYSSILKMFDDYQQHVTNSIFDNGINLTHAPKFDEVLLNPLAVLKTEVLKKLFEYK